MTANERIINTVRSYYSEKLSKYGPTPMGVDWKNEESQILRFQKLIAFLELSHGDTLLDYGCGYGALLDYLRKRNITVKYLGYDLSPEMIAAAREIHQDYSHKFFSSKDILSSYKYIVLSGVFNVKGKVSDSSWKRYIITTVNELIDLTTKALSLNFLSAQSPNVEKREYLYYANPLELINKLNLNSRFTVIIDHSFSDWEFNVTIIK